MKGRSKNSRGNLYNNLCLVIYEPHDNAIREEACIKYYVSYKVCAENAKGTKCHDCANSKGKVHHIAMWNALNSLPHVHIDSHAVEQARCLCGNCTMTNY